MLAVPFAADIAAEIHVGRPAEALASLDDNSRRGVKDRRSIYDRVVNDAAGGRGAGQVNVLLGVSQARESHCPRENE